MNGRRTTFSKHTRVGAGFVALASFLAALLVPLTATPASALPLGPETTFQCPGGGFYVVDASGLAYGGGTGQYQDASATIFNGGACAGNLILDGSVIRIDTFGFESAPLTGLTIPNTVTSIANAAFGYTGLTALTIPDSVVSIGTSAFLGVNLTSLSLGNSLATIGNSAFVSATLSTLTLPGSVTSVGSSAFRNSPLTALTLNSASITLGSNAFSATATSNLACFNNLGGATISQATLVSAVLPPECVINSTPAPAPPAPAPAAPAPTATPTPTATSEPTATPTPEPTASPTPAPASASSQVASFKIAGFQPGSSAVQPTTRKALRALPLKAAEISRIILTGYSEGPVVLKADYDLAKKRAEAVRADLRTLLGKSVKVEIRVRTLTKVGSQHRAVHLSVWP